MAAFDYDDFKKRWRARAAHFKIDLERGATSYQVVLVKAAMMLPARHPLDWSTYEPLHPFADESEARDETEGKAWRAINDGAWRSRGGMVLADAETFRALYAEVVRDHVAERIMDHIAKYRAAVVQLGLGLELSM